MGSLRFPILAMICNTVTGESHGMETMALVSRKKKKEKRKVKMQDLGQIQLNEKMTGVQLVAVDANTPPDNVPSFNGLTLTATPVGIVSFANQAASPATPTNPAGSTFTVDIIAENIGQVTITAQGQQGNFLPVFTTQFTIEVVANPNTPGPPVAWVVTPGTVVSQ